MPLMVFWTAATSVVAFLVAVTGLLTVAVVVVLLEEAVSLPVVASLPVEEAVVSVAAFVASGGGVFTALTGRISAPVRVSLCTATSLVA